MSSLSLSATIDCRPNTFIPYYIEQNNTIFIVTTSYYIGVLLGDTSIFIVIICYISICYASNNFLSNAYIHLLYFS